MRVLALDLATNFGFACGSVAEGVVASGSYRLPKTGEEIGLFLAYYRKWLNDGITRMEPREIVFEMPILPRETSLMTLRKLYGLTNMTELVALDRSIACTEENVGDITTHFLGKGAPRTGDAKKRATIAECRNRGFEPKDDDHADALALLDYVLAKKSPGRALRATPLFRGAT